MNFSPYANIQRSNSWPGRKILRKMAYLSDQRGIITRYLHEQEGWREHLENTREFVLLCLREARPSSVIVLGSGWLLDFPLEEAHKICRNITLADIEHPPQIVRKVSNYPNIHLILDDITGGMIQRTYDFVQSIRKNPGKYSIDQLEICTPQKDPGTYYISLNILNQLDILLVDYLQNYLHPSPQEIDTFRTFLQRSHIRLVQSKGCLVTDIQELHEDFRGKPLGNKNLLYTELPSTDLRKEWTWNFDTSGTYHRGRVTRMKVVALSC